MFGSFSEDALKKFRDAMLNTEQQTNMPSRGMASTFEEKIAWKRNEITGELQTADEANKIPAAPAGKGKKKKAMPKGATQSGVSQSTKAAQEKGAAIALNKQANRAGRDAQMKNLQKINSQRVNPG